MPGPVFSVTLGSSLPRQSLKASQENQMKISTRLVWCVLHSLKKVFWRSKVAMMVVPERHNSRLENSRRDFLPKENETVGFEKFITIFLLNVK